MANISYVTLTQLKRQWDSENANNATLSNPVMMEYARTATSKVERITGNEFMPRIETLYFDAKNSEDSGWHIDTKRNTMSVPPILELTTTVLGDGTSLTTDTDVRLSPRGSEPAFELAIYYPSTALWTDYTDDPIDAIAITGVWGWRDRHSVEGWQLSGDAVKTDALTTSSTTVKITDANGTNWIGDTPRFDLGQLIKIDDEYMAVVSTDTSTNELTVIRAIRGSTAATHEIGAAISVFVPQPEIIRATQLIAFFDYARRGNIKQVTFDGVTTVEGIEVPKEVVEILGAFTFIKIGGS
jgi:hypothetical protein